MTLISLRSIKFLETRVNYLKENQKQHLEALKRKQNELTSENRHRPINLSF